MKETVFTFSLRLQGDTSLDSVREALLSIEDVIGVNMGGTAPCIDLRIHVRIKDFDSAERLHRMIGKHLMRTDGITITGVSTTMTDIID
ncbi:MAG TPA: hypothetical protein VMM76_23375 [Pirellulaceae bacterium]|nr:hypothetical protein [Pirellulaceae bacterium]